jgi:transcriptional regulator with XRE-family HTH domain
MKQQKRVVCAELNELKGALRTRKITYRMLAARIGRSVAWVSDVMNGFASPDIVDMYAICEAAGIGGESISVFFISPYVAKRKNDAQRTKRKGA